MYYVFHRTVKLVELRYLFCAQVFEYVNIVKIVPTLMKETRAKM